MASKVEQHALQKYKDAKKAGDLNIMFDIIDNGKPLYMARTKCNGVANFIKQRIAKIKRLNVKKNYNWFSIQQINRAEAGNGDEQDCCLQIALQPKSSSRKTKINPIQKLFAQLGLCKNGGWAQPMLCSLSYDLNGNRGWHMCFNFGDRPRSHVFDECGQNGAQTLLATAHCSALGKLLQDVPHQAVQAGDIDSMFKFCLKG